MERNMFARFADNLKHLREDGIRASDFELGKDRKYHLQYIPFEHVNRNARLVIVGITPGNNQLDLAYRKAQELLSAGLPEKKILIEIKKYGAFGGSSMKPNLLKMLRHFEFNKILGIDDVELLWGSNADLLHSTSTVPHAAFKAGKMFAGSFDEVMSSPLLKQCFVDCFVPSAAEMNQSALFVGLGQCPQAALDWCVREGVLSRRQVLGSFCHPSATGGSTVKYYLQETNKTDLKPSDPVRHRVDWLDQAYAQMRSATFDLLDANRKTPVEKKAAPASVSTMPTLSAKIKPMKPALYSPTDTSAEIVTILKEIERAGYKPTNTTSKLSEFQSPAGQTIYVVKTTSKLNNINLMVHPGHKHDVLRAIDGVDSVSSEHRFHSNMTRFPKRLNKGKTETAYGWQLTVDTFARLPLFLNAFKIVSF